MSMPDRNGDWMLRTSADEYAPQRTASRKVLLRQTETDGTYYLAFTSVPPEAREGFSEVIEAGTTV